MRGIDLMVIGDVDVAEIRANVDAASRQLGRDVNVTVLTLKEWDRGETGFLRHLKTPATRAPGHAPNRPLVSQS